QVVLHALEPARELLGHVGLEQGEADRGVELVDGAVGLDAGMHLGDTAHVAEMRLAAVAELGVDAGEVYCHLLVAIGPAVAPAPIPGAFAAPMIGVPATGMQILRVIGYVPALHADWRSEGDGCRRAPGCARARGRGQAEGNGPRRARAERRGHRCARARRRVRAGG